MNVENYILKLTVAPQYQLESPKNEEEIKNTRKVLSAEIIGKLELGQSVANENKKILKFQKCTTEDVVENCTTLDIRSPYAWASDYGRRDKNAKQRWQNVILKQKYWLLECPRETLEKKVIQDDDRRYYAGLFRVKASELFQSFSTRYPAFYSTPLATSENCVACVYKNNNFDINEKKIEFKSVPLPITRFVFIKDETIGRIYGPYRWCFSSGKLILEALTAGRKSVPGEYQINIPYYNLNLGDVTYEMASFYGARISNYLSDFEEQFESDFFNSKAQLESFGRTVGNIIERLNKDTRSKKKPGSGFSSIGVLNPSGGLIKVARPKTVETESENVPSKPETDAKKSDEIIPTETNGIAHSTNVIESPNQDAPESKVLEELEKLATSCLEEDSIEEKPVDELPQPTKDPETDDLDTDDDSSSACDVEDMTVELDIRVKKEEKITRTPVVSHTPKPIEPPKPQPLPIEKPEPSPKREESHKKPLEPPVSSAKSLPAEHIVKHENTIHHAPAVTYTQSTAFSGAWKEPGSVLNPDVSSLIKHIYHTVHDEYGNQSFSSSDAANIMLCISQNMLTIITGRPGCGKTSFVRQLSKSLGLTRPEFNRFHEVHVGCDWRSGRDLLGYYNPVNGRFEGTSLYRSLKSYELFERNQHYPYWVLLDDANMSPLEGYLSDFRGILDIDLLSKSGYHIETGATVAGQSDGIEIPSSLRFIATFSDDYSRYYNMQVLQRAWVISLPEVSNWDSIFTPVTDHYKDSVLVSQSVIDNLCMLGISELGTDTECGVCGLCYNIYCSLMEILKILNIKLQKGAWTSIRRYCFAAKKLHLMLDEMSQTSFEEDDIILDYVVSQRILPMVHKNGKKIRTSLKTIQDKYGNMIPNSSAIITDIIDRGDVSSFYSFFDRH